MTEEASSHINLLKLKAAYLSLQYFLEESVSTFWYKAGQLHSHLILESYWETGLFPVSTSTRHMDLVPCSSDYSSCGVLAWS